MKRLLYFIGGWCMDYALRALHLVMNGVHLFRRHVLREKPPTYPEDKDQP